MPAKKIIVVNNGTVASNRARRNLGEKNYSLWGGGVTTVMSPSEENSGDIILAELQCVPSVVGAGVMNVNKVKMVPNTNTRRLDQIESLQIEVDAWEQRNKRLEEEMAALRAEKEEMAFILAAHRTSCRLQTDSEVSVEVKMEPQPSQAPQPQ